MSVLRQRKPRRNLDSETYRALCKQALERDGWRCQLCGALRNLQVHHTKFRSSLGDDTTEDLIMLCQLPSSGARVSEMSTSVVLCKALCQP